MSPTPTRLRDLPAGHLGRTILTGRTPSFAARLDPRFSYALFVPEDIRDDEPPLRLWVFVHGTGRQTELYLDRLADLARAERAVVMTPHFPAGVGGADAIDNYHDLAYAGIRFDEVLLGMVDDVAHRWNVEPSTFFLHGFSGGGQFSHRFLYVHPGRLTAVSIGAPGRVTLPAATAGWPRGIGDLSDRFGHSFDADAVARVPIQVLAGSLDDTPSTGASYPGDGGPDRLSRAHSLAAALRDLGARVQMDVVDGVGHDGAAVLPAVVDFLESRILAR
jgi:poly(3-hydroxybutyrate) depolymerase